MRPYLPQDAGFLTLKPTSAYSGWIKGACEAIYRRRLSQILQQKKNNGTPDLWTALSICLTLFYERAKGFSQKMALPVSTPCIT